MKLVRASALVAAMAIAPAVLFSSPAMAAGDGQPAAVSVADKAGDAKPGGGEKGAALADEENQVAIARILGDKNSGPGVREAAQKALDGTPEDRVRFLTTGQHEQRLIDDHVRVSRIIGGGGPTVREYGKAALQDGSAAAIKRFLEEQLPFARKTDLRIKVTQVGGAGGPAVHKAAYEALRADTDEALNHFLEVGQHEARAKDKAAEDAAKGKDGKDQGGTSGTGHDGGKDAKDGKVAKPTPSAGTDQAKQGGSGTEAGAKPSASASASASAQGSGASAKSGGSELAFTGAGSATPWIVGGTVVALGAGAGLVVAARRRGAAQR
ncbi:ALF repeat-containing protein [Streptomyces hesseae]|uniref:ALF repeat-containing protein n=1 Tax=Streptomyces hesseae TaxID=3075519 RepID=A0ABU2SSI8_9ACTN|nr:ALF repeat-containing protein [Streptomyces sp. DSM 40473]MDT0451967.1 ALF repeat-containing protein [Streptomyces sp. DSM 40473]